MDLCRKRGRMEADIERWLSFAVKVENKLQTMNNDTYSDRYIAGISNLLNELRHEAAIVKTRACLKKRTVISELISLGKNSEIQRISRITLKHDKSES